MEYANKGISNRTVITTVHPNRKLDAFIVDAKNKNNNPSTTLVPADKKKISSRNMDTLKEENANLNCSPSSWMMEVEGEDGEDEADNDVVKID